jgi:hypothetical protein
MATTSFPAPNLQSKEIRRVRSCLNRPFGDRAVLYFKIPIDKNIITNMQLAIKNIKNKKISDYIYKVEYQSGGSCMDTIFGDYLDYINACDYDVSINNYLKNTTKIVYDEHDNIKLDFWFNENIDHGIQSLLWHERYIVITCAKFIHEINDAVILYECYDYNPNVNIPYVNYIPYSEHCEVDKRDDGSSICIFVKKLNPLTNYDFDLSTLDKLIILFEPNKRYQKLNARIYNKLMTSVVPIQELRNYIYEYLGVNSIKFSDTNLLYNYPIEIQNIDSGESFNFYKSGEVDVKLFDIVRICGNKTKIDVDKLYKNGELDSDFDRTCERIVEIKLISPGAKLFSFNSNIFKTKNNMSGKEFSS